MNKKDKLLLLSAIEVAIIDYYSAIDERISNDGLFAGHRPLYKGICCWAWLVIDDHFLRSLFVDAAQALRRKKGLDVGGFWWRTPNYESDKYRWRLLGYRLEFLEQLFYHVENDLLNL